MRRFRVQLDSGSVLKICPEVFVDCILAPQCLEAPKEVWIFLREELQSTPLVRFYACHVQKKNGQFLDLIAGMLRENLQPPNVSGGNVRLSEKAIKLIHAFDEVALFERQTLAIFADMVAMPLPGELFVATISTADMAIVRHASVKCMDQSMRVQIDALISRPLAAGISVKIKI